MNAFNTAPLKKTHLFLNTARPGAYFFEVVWVTLQERVRSFFHDRAC